MKDELRIQCMNYIENRNVIKETYKLENQYMISVAASIAASKKIILTKEKLKEASELVDSKTGILSSFRGNVKLALIAILATHENPTEYMTRIAQIYNMAKKEWLGSEYLVVASAVLAEIIKNDEEVEKVIARGKALYKKMRKEHPILTSDEDAIYACLMAISEKDDETLIEEMEACFRYIKAEMRPDENALQTLTHVLTIAPGNYADKCDKVLNLYKAIKDKGRRYSKHHELSVLGSLAVTMTDSLDSVVNDIMDIDNFLSSQKGYGILSIDKKTRLMHSCMLLVNQYNGSQSGNVSAVSAVISQIAAQNAAICACICAACISATVVTSSN